MWQLAPAGIYIRNLFPLQRTGRMGVLSLYLHTILQWDHNQRDRSPSCKHALCSPHFLSTGIIVTNDPCYRLPSRSCGSVSPLQVRLASLLSVKKGIYLNAFTGIIVCWVVLYLFSRAIGSYWGPVLYSVFSTLLQGIFCLGTNI